MYKILILILLSHLLVAAQGSAFKVTDSVGRPISKVDVRSLKSIADWTETNEKGEFRINKSPTYLLLLKSGFAPLLTKVASVPGGSFVLRMATAEDTLTLSECGNLKAFGKKHSAWNTVGDYIILPIKKEEELKRSSDVDYQAYSVYFSKDYRFNAALQGIWGPNASDGFPFDDWIEESNDIRIRTIQFGNEIIGEDWIGLNKNGKRWRYIRVFWESARYETEKVAAATFFDSILERACFNTKHTNWKRIKTENRRLK